MIPRNNITALTLRVPSPSDAVAFYSTMLGMPVITESGSTAACAFNPAACKLVFQQADVGDFVQRSNGFYWKIGITVDNLQVAVQFLREQGVAVTPPKQFQEIGYLSHLTDPAGFPVELLQRGFEGHELPVAHGHPIGVQGALAHITLRVTDIDRAQCYFGSTLGMRLMSVQPVSDYGFCLYFYAWSTEVLPDPDLESVSNREWLWARPYTLIELQHLQAKDAVIHVASSLEAGFDGFSFGASADEQQTEVPTGEILRCL